MLPSQQGGETPGRHHQSDHEEEHRSHPRSALEPLAGPGRGAGTGNGVGNPIALSKRRAKERKAHPDDEGGAERYDELDEKHDGKRSEAQVRPWRPVPGGEREPRFMSADLPPPCCSCGPCQELWPSSKKVLKFEGRGCR
jgi:hypothetical protein